MEDAKLFGLPARSGRWLFVILGIIALLCLGTVYSWSIFRKPLEQMLDLSATDSMLPFTALLVFYSAFMPVAGLYIKRWGAKKMTALGGAIAGLGYILSAFAPNLGVLILTYGAIGGAGVGIAYGVPLAVAASWFPDRKGLAVGLTAIGFGLSPVITAPLARFSIETFGMRSTFIILGIGLAAIVLAISTTLELAPANWQQSWNRAKGASPAPTQEARSQLPMLRSPQFYGLWLCYTIGTFVGLSAIGISSPVAQEIIKIDPATAAATVSLFAVFNGLGRPLFGWLSDRFQPHKAAVASYVLILIASILMLNAREGHLLTYLVAFSLFWLCLGGWLALAPTATITLFSPENYAKNYGIVFTAYGVGAFLGTTLAGSLRDMLGSYTYAFYPTAILAIVGIILAFGLLARSSRFPEIANLNHSSPKI